MATRVSITREDLSEMLREAAREAVAEYVAENATGKAGAAVKPANTFYEDVIRHGKSIPCAVLNAEGKPSCAKKFTTEARSQEHWHATAK